MGVCRLLQLPSCAQTLTQSRSTIQEHIPDGGAAFPLEQPLGTVELACPHIELRPVDVGTRRLVHVDCM